MRLSLCFRSMLALLLANLAFGGIQSRDLSAMPDTASGEFIVQYVVKPSSTDLGEITKAGGKITRNLNSVDGVVASMTAKGARTVANNSRVKFVSPNRSLRGRDVYTNDATNATAAQGLGWTGANIGVAVIDSGVSVVSDFDTRIVYSQTFVAQPANEAYGHGTHVAGIIAGSNTTYRGIAPQVKIISLRVLDDQGQGSDSSVIAAIDRAIELKATYNIRVINLSLGRGVFESYTLDPLCQAAERAWQAGIVVVAAAGNLGRYGATNGYATIGSPGIDPFVITVGGMKSMSTLGRADDQIASYSSKGPTLIDHIIKPDLVAPGNTVISASAAGNSVLDAVIPQNKVGGGYLILSGTSMSAPAVSGAVALMLQKTPALTPNQVKARLMKTAYKQFPAASTWVDISTGVSYTSTYDIFTVGAGYLDITAALASNDLSTAASTTPLSPIAVYDATTRTVRMVGGSSLVWGDSLVWGESLVWGNSLVWGDSLVWGSSLVWGDSTTSGFSLVWGNSLVWGDSLVWGETIMANGEK